MLLFIQVINRKISIYLNQSCQQYSLKSQRKNITIFIQQLFHQSLAIRPQRGS